MRIRATVAAVSGALALSALAVPAAQAAGDSSPSRADILKTAQIAREAASSKTAFTGSTAADGEPYEMDLTFSNVKINSGKPIVAGISNQVTVPVTYTVTHPADVDVNDPDFYMDVEIYRGSYDDPSNMLFGDDWPVCTDSTSTVATCKGTIDIYPSDELSNADAASWKADGWAVDYNGQDPDDPDADWSQVGYATQDGLATTKLQRYSKLTVNASPEPVSKGKTITVTGKLTRANWDKHAYAGYTLQSVKLQYKKQGTTSYTTLKTITSDSTGYLKTTTTAGYDGYYRYSFAGTSTTPAVTSYPDFVDVQ
ncbi:hypothetical protein [Streptomyces sp. V3I7]|uniref:hypothetical protein n=1 Tax=Streptomyces sp. V3I7 TaxID=3042278 RepID=UPI0027813CEA|nr:hypothetical protein [Streptomyces sp. V3I7]MDQ0991529.1 hypothetical protein [Streptomyces sp. V3I7]